jgi:hypothetical protein
MQRKGRKRDGKTERKREYKRKKERIIENAAPTISLSSTDINSYRIVVPMCVECGAAGWSRLCFPIV